MLLVFFASSMKEIALADSFPPRVIQLIWLVFPDPHSSFIKT